MHTALQVIGIICSARIVVLLFYLFSVLKKFIGVCVTYSVCVRVFMEPFYTPLLTESLRHVAQARVLTEIADTTVTKIYLG